jgi:hypothetical protein
LTGSRAPAFNASDLSLAKTRCANLFTDRFAYIFDLNPWGKDDAIMLLQLLVTVTFVSAPDLSA